MNGRSVKDILTDFIDNWTFSEIFTWAHNIH